MALEHYNAKEAVAEGTLLDVRGMTFATVGLELEMVLCRATSHGATRAVLGTLLGRPKSHGDLQVVQATPLGRPKNHADLRVAVETLLEYPKSHAGLQVVVEMVLSNPMSRAGPPAVQETALWSCKHARLKGLACAQRNHAMRAAVVVLKQSRFGAPAYPV